MLANRSVRPMQSGPQGQRCCHPTCVCMNAISLGNSDIFGNLTLWDQAADACALRQAGYLLREVLEIHPAMKVVITREVEKFLFRPGLQERARYYGVIFLNQMPLSHNAAQGMSHPFDHTHPCTGRLAIWCSACGSLMNTCACCGPRHPSSSRYCFVHNAVQGMPHASEHFCDCFIAFNN